MSHAHMCHTACIVMWHVMSHDHMCYTVCIDMWHAMSHAHMCYNACIVMWRVMPRSRVLHCRHCHVVCHVTCSRVLHCMHCHVACRALLTCVTLHALSCGISCHILICVTLYVLWDVVSHTYYTACFVVWCVPWSRVLHCMYYPVVSHVMHIIKYCCFDFYLCHGVPQEGRLKPGAKALVQVSQVVAEPFTHVVPAASQGLHGQEAGWGPGDWRGHHNSRGDAGVSMPAA